MKHNRDVRRTGAIKRAEERAELTDKQQLERLDHLLGKGQGAVRERARLALRIERAEQAELQATKKKAPK